MERKIFFEERAAGKQTPHSETLPSGKGVGPGQMGPLQLHWPTDYRVITQGFGINPELVTERKLPGHEGLDIRAPLHSRVYACADGVVESVHEQVEDRDPYGRWVRIQHANGYRSLYAHLGTIAVHKGSQVTARQVIGQAGPSGDTAGGHIHLSLMWDGATAAGFSNYPGDLIDPTPYLIVTPPPKDIATYPWPIGRCLAGVSVEADGKYQLPASNPSPEAFRLSLQTSVEQIAQLRKNNVDAFFMTRVRVPLKSGDWSPRAWAAQINPMLKLHADAGISYFELHTAPNLAREGCFDTWLSGHEFARWWIDVVNLLRESYPFGKFGFPGLAPGAHVPGERLEAQVFMEQADEALLSADWIGVRCNWNNSSEMVDENHGARDQIVRRWYPEKLLFVTDCGNTNPSADLKSHQREAARFYDRVKPLSGIGAVIF
jgi:hypothetical protein